MNVNLSQILALAAYALRVLIVDDRDLRILIVDDRDDCGVVIDEHEGYVLDVIGGDSPPPGVGWARHECEEDGERWHTWEMPLDLWQQQTQAALATLSRLAAVKVTENDDDGRLSVSADDYRVDVQAVPDASLGSYGLRWGTDLGTPEETVTQALVDLAAGLLAERMQRECPRV
jgi:hypothetical protein